MASKLLRGDTIATIGLAAAALFIIVLLGALAFELFSGSAASISKFGIGFLYGTKWNPDKEIFGALPFIYGTFLTSAIAVIIGLPISIGIAVFISERLNGHLAIGYGLGTLVDLLAAVPSVVYGLWGLLIFAPLLRNYVEKPLNKSLGFIPLFGGTPYATSFFTAGVVLAIMIIPTMSAVSGRFARSSQQPERSYVRVGCHRLGSHSEKRFTLREVRVVRRVHSRVGKSRW